MPRAAGESDKLGNRYEGVWTVDSLLDVLSGEATALTVEPFGEDARGVEFVKVLSDGRKEFHSAKRQTTGNVWSFSALTAPDARGNSTLGHLTNHLQRDPAASVVFVSGTTANELHELWERAERSQTFAAFEEQLATSAAIRGDFEHHWLPLFSGDGPSAFSALKRMRIVGEVESRLIQVVEQKIRSAFYRIAGDSLDPMEARLSLGELVPHWFGQQITASTIRKWMLDHGYGERDWTRDRTTQERVRALAVRYLSHVEAELISGAQIERTEAIETFDALRDAMKRRVVILGNAGLGKSCTTAQVIRLLTQAEVPCLPVRLDVQSDALTSQQLGAQFDLQVSPAIVLAGIANGRESVLVLDQLDALSFASGRNQRLWDVFDELLREAGRYPNMRVLLVCREFDAEHDPRLRAILADSDHSHVVKLKPLELGQVRATIERAGIDPKSLTERALQLLQTPLHLSLYLQGNPGQQPSFTTVQDLLGRYWEHKRRLASGVRWHEVIKRLADSLSDRQALSAPAHVLDEFAADADRLCTLHVFVRDGSQFRFFHESFFDYCWARIFVSEKRRLLELLTTSEQHLFRRAQVRQVLAYERGTDFEAYLRDLGEMLLDSRVRFHLKKLALDWLRSLDEPRVEEWTLLQKIPTHLAIARFVSRVPFASVPWFDLLHRLGQWERWLDSADESEAAHAAWLLSMTEVAKARSREVATLFAPCAAGRRRWLPMFRIVFQYGGIHGSREMFDLFLWAARNGHLDNADSMAWHSCEEMAEARPDFTLELIEVLIEKLGDESGDQNRVRSSVGDMPPNFCSTAALRLPEAFARRILPLVTQAISRPKPDCFAGPFGGDSWRTFGDDHDFESSLRAALNDALGTLAREQPATLLELTAPLEMLADESAAVIILSAWSQNGPHFADRGVDYLLTDSERLDLGYFSWSGGNGHAAFSRAAVGAFSPHCTEDRFWKLEAAILRYSSSYEREDPKRIGYISLLLLHCLPEARLSAAAKQRHRELLDKFPGIEFGMPSGGCEVRTIGPPIENSVMMKMTDDGWIGAMRKYSGERNRQGADFFKGGLHELASALRRIAQSEKARFASLALRMPDDIRAEYFDSILSGITTTRLESGGEEMPHTATEPLDTPAIEAVIRRLHAFPGRPCGEAICRAVEVIAARSPSQDLTEIISHYAQNDTDPEKETWQDGPDGKKMWGGDPHFQGINTVRGTAAGAIAALLFADRDLLHRLEPAMLAVVHDRSIAVRSCAVHILLAMLNFDRPRAVRLFLELCDGADDVLGTHHINQFLHHACYDRYSDLRVLMQRMLTLDEKEARTAAAAQIAVASLHDTLACEDLPRVLAADAVCRQAAARVFALNLKSPRCAEQCRQNLKVLFDDPDKEVRAAAAHCFRHLSADEVPQEEVLMSRFVESAACVENTNDLVTPLEKAVTALPEIVCRLPERLIEEQCASNDSKPIETRRWTHHLPSLIARLYDQTRDPKIKARCLDIMDGMLEFGFSEIDQELEKVER